MKTSFLIPVLILLAGPLFFLQTYSISANKPLLVEDTSKSFAVVELFTSEGCSSCPPADRLLSELVDEAEAGKKPIFALSFHVDYWNYIGWKDPYSDKAYSIRQRKYAAAFQSSRIYTPQMIVNGSWEFVGSNARSLKKNLAVALKDESSVEINVSPFEEIDGEIRVGYEVQRLPQLAHVNVALVERDLNQHVGRGENSGKLLKHDNVVRAFKVFAAGKRSVTLKPPADVNLQKSSVIVYVQDERTMRILGAAASKLTIN